MEKYYDYLVFNGQGKGIMHWNCGDDTMSEFIEYCATKVDIGAWDLNYTVKVNGPKGQETYTLEELLNENLHVQN